jgi:uncharacterized membrane protein YeaQ/YmgE (transglycosylase-associated protein family)
MLFIYVLVVGSIVGIILARQFNWRMLIYVLIGVVGAFIGGFLGFGDAPFLLRHSYLNSWTLSIIVSVFLVTVTWILGKSTSPLRRGTTDSHSDDEMDLG